MPVLIIVSGPPCVGKTTLSKKIAKEFHLICLSRDWFKELLFDHLGWSNVKWFEKIGAVSLDLLYFVCGLLMFAKQSFIVDSTLDPKTAHAKFLRLKNKYHYNIFEINCFSEGSILFERYLKRAPSRHPGYVDHLRQPEIKERLLAGRIEPLNLGKVIELDTSHFHKVDYKNLFNQITHSLKLSHHAKTPQT